MKAVLLYQSYHKKKTMVTPLGAILKHVNKNPNVDSVSVPCASLQIPCVRGGYRILWRGGPGVLQRCV